MTLEAFWKGQIDEVRFFLDPEIAGAFDEAIAERKAAGQRLDNRLIQIEQALIAAASLTGKVASITVRFEADIAAITRDAEDNVIAGSLSDAVQTRDRWTFRRDLASSDPNWILIETDDE
jgi:predicted lipid-binding transport protein (Tim44 family)